MGGKRYGEVLKFRSQYTGFEGIKVYHQEDQDGKAQKGGTTIAKKGQRYPDDWHEPYRHTDIYQDVEKENGYDSIAINPGKFRLRIFCHDFYSPDKRKE